MDIINDRLNVLNTQFNKLPNWTFNPILNNVYYIYLLIIEINNALVWSTILLVYMCSD
jgi:hypothetical protein